MIPTKSWSYRLSSFGLSSRKLVVLTILLAAFGSLAWSQAPKMPTKSVKGEVLGPEDVPLVKAVVQLKDLKTLNIRSFVTQEDGAYHFNGLRKDTDYELKATWMGKDSDTKRLSSFDTRDDAMIVLRIKE